jgi:hypothetical protein
MRQRPRDGDHLLGPALGRGLAVTGLGEKVKLDALVRHGPCSFLLYRDTQARAADPVTYVTGKCDYFINAPGAKGAAGAPPRQAAGALL